MAHPPRQLRDFVEARADGRCLTAPHNLAFACRRCNLLKGDATEALDRRSGRRVPLFNPRRDRWGDHFRLAATKYGYTAVLRSAVRQLRYCA